MTSLTMKRSASKNKAGRSVPHHQPVEDDSRTNCHQCSRRSESDKMRCSNERLANRECGLRYCKTCIEKHPDIFFDPNNDHFKCPRCEDRCLCAKCRGLRGERPTSPSGHVLKRASKHSTSSRSTGNKSRSPAVEKKSHSMQRPKINQKQKQVTSAPVEEKEEDYPEESVESEGEDDEDDEFDEDEEEETSIQPQAAPASHAPQLSLDFGTTNLQVIENRPVPLLSQGWHGLDEHLATPDEQSHEPQFTPRANFQSTALPTPPSSTSRPSLKVIFGGNEQRRSTGTLSGFARSRLFDSPRSKRRAATTESRPRAEVWVRGPADLSGSEASDSEIETDDKSLRNSKAGREGPRRTLSGLAQSFNQDSEDAGSFGGFKPSEAGSTYPYADSNPPHHEDHTFYGLSSSHGPEPWMQHSTHSEETSTAASSTSYLGSHDSDSGAYMNMSMDLDVDLDLRSPSQNERASSDYFSSSNVPDTFNRVSSPFKPSPFKSDYVYQDPFHQGNYFDYDQPFASSPETTAATSSSGRSSLGELEIGAPWGEALRMSSASISSGSGSGSSSQLSHGHSLDLSQSWHSSDDHGMMQLDLEDHQQPQQSNQSKNLQQTLPSSYDIDSHPELAALAFHLLHNPEKESSTPQTPSGMVMSVE